MKIDTDTSQKILEAARQLAGAIGASEPYLRFESALQKFRQDETAKDLLMQYRRVERRVQMGLQDDLTAVRDQVMENPTLKEYFEAQEALIKELQELNGYVSERLGFDFASLARPAGGCCG